ncbi:hypothetical protein E2562_033314, partial [Oryza meyeriana var. granulata]
MEVGTIPACAHERENREPRSTVECASPVATKRGAAVTTSIHGGALVATEPGAVPSPPSEQAL